MTPTPPLPETPNEGLEPTLQHPLLTRTQQLLRQAVLAGTLSTSFLQHHAAAFLCEEEEPVSTTAGQVG
jgi:hypothetical protein